MIEITGSEVNLRPDVSALLRVYRDGFRSLAGEPLDRDYTLPVAGCDGCFPFITVRAALPAAGAATSDPAAPISVYFNWPVDPSSLQMELSDGPSGPLVASFFHGPEATPNRTVQVARSLGSAAAIISRPAIARPF